MWSSTTCGNESPSPLNASARIARHKESLMKITVIKKTNGKVKTMAMCPWILDEPSVSKS
jgi:hypothetical protein